MHKRSSNIPRGAIVLVPFPFTDLTSAKVRPALVISIDNTASVDIVVLFVSSAVQKKSQSSDVQINTQNADFQASGLRVPSTIKCRKVATLDRAIVLGEIGRLGTETMKRIDTVLKKTLGLS